MDRQVHLLHNKRQCLLQVTSCNCIFWEMYWCAVRVLTGLFSLLHCWPGEAERGWTPQLPSLLDYVSGSGHIHTHTHTIKRDIYTLNHMYQQFNTTVYRKFLLLLLCRFTEIYTRNSGHIGVTPLLQVWCCYNGHYKWILFIYLHTVGQSWYDSLGQKFLFYSITVWT